MDIETPHIFWLAAAAFAVLAGLAALADRRRGSRRDLDRPGWVPWALVQVLAILLTAVCAALGVLV